MKKKVLVLLLILTMLCAVFALVACDGGSGNNGDNYNEDGSVNYSNAFKIDKNGTIKSLTKFGKTLEDVVIPEEIDGKKVTAIGEKAFWKCSTIKSVEIASSVTSLGEYAFASSEKLESVKFADDSQLTSVGEMAFASCISLKSVELPSGVTSIDVDAFYGCESLESITLPFVDIVDRITDGDILVVRSILDSWFTGCEFLNLKEIIVTGGTSVGEGAFCAFNKSLKNIELPSSIVSIGWSAFYKCENLESVTFGENSQLTSIDEEAFRDCKSLKSVEIPSGVTSIDAKTFSGCSSLTSIVIPSGVKSIGIGAFANCNCLTIYCEVESQPSGWSTYWNFSNCPVVWGYKAEQ